MVILHYKKTDVNQFLYQVKGDTPVVELIQQLFEVCNMRVKLDLLSHSIEDLAKLGAMKPEELRGLTTIESIKGALDMMSAEKRKKYDFFDSPREVPSNMKVVEDKHGYRWGIVHNDSIREVMIKEVDKVRAYLSKNNVDLKKCLILKEMKELFDCLKGAMMIAYPGYTGLPDYEPARMILEDEFQYNGRVNDNFDYFTSPDDISIWYAGKEMQRGKLVRDHVGKNEKTKVIIRIQKPSQGPPVREPAVDQETQKKMMAYYYKKQEEHKKLEENEDDHYLSSQWANPQNLKNAILGTNQIKWRG